VSSFLTAHQHIKGHFVPCILVQGKLSNKHMHTNVTRHSYNKSHFTTAFMVFQKLHHSVFSWCLYVGRSVGSGL